MFVSKYLKKKIGIFLSTLIVIGICFFVSIVVNKNNNINTKDLVIKSGNLQIIYENGIDGVKNSLYPLSYQQGIDESPSNIVKVINKGKKTTSFKVYLVEKEQNENNLDVNKIYFSVNNGNPVILGSINDGVIYSANIPKKEERILDIKFWAGSDLISNKDSGKSLNLEIKVK